MCRRGNVLGSGEMRLRGQLHMFVLVVAAVCCSGLLAGVEHPQAFTFARSRLAFSLVTAGSPSVATSPWENWVIPQAMGVVCLHRIFLGREMADV